MTNCHRLANIGRLPNFLPLVVLGMCSPLAIALGPGELFITNWSDNSVTVYSRTAIGTPNSAVRTIRTGLNYPFGIFVDQLHQEVFVTNKCQSDPCGGYWGSVQVYDLHANYPNDTPKRTIIGNDTGLFHPAGLAVDPFRNELYVTNDEGGSITVFSLTAHGDARPSRTIQGPASLLNGPVAVTLDLLHDEIFVVNKVSSIGGAGLITVYPRSSNGNISPKRSIGGGNQGFNLPVGIDVDLLRDEIVVANAFSNSVLAFHRTDTGDVAPLRILQGGSTGLCVPTGVVVEPLNNEIVVANSGLVQSGPSCGQSTTVYRRPAGGNQAPLRILNLPGSTGPVSLAETLLSLN